MTTATAPTADAPGYENFTGLRVALDSGVAWVTIDNGPINLFDQVLYGDLRRLGPLLAADDRVRVVVLQSANPDFFIAHFDVDSFSTSPDRCRSRRRRPRSTTCARRSAPCPRQRS